MLPTFSMILLRLSSRRHKHKESILCSKCLIRVFRTFSHSNDPVIDQCMHTAESMYCPSEVAPVVHKRVAGSRTSVCEKINSRNDGQLKVTVYLRLLSKTESRNIVWQVGFFVFGWYTRRMAMCRVTFGHSDE